MCKNTDLRGQVVVADDVRSFADERGLRFGPWEGNPLGAMLGWTVRVPSGAVGFLRLGASVGELVGFCSGIVVGVALSFIVGPDSAIRQYMLLRCIHHESSGNGPITDKEHGTASSGALHVTFSSSNSTNSRVPWTVLLLMHNWAVPDHKTAVTQRQDRVHNSLCDNAGSDKIYQCLKSSSVVRFHQQKGAIRRKQ